MRARNLRLFLGGSMLAVVPLLLSGCGQNSSNPAASETPTEAAATPSDTGEASGNAYVVDETAAPAVTDVVALPAPVAAADPAEAAPLDDAETIVREIGDGHGIERVRHGDGWAWMRDGHIIRTASSDGKRVAYFRNGSDNPFLVQNGDHAYAYSGNTVTHAYDRGRPQKVDSGERKDADKLAGKARDDHKDAQQVADTHHRPTPAPSPSPSSTHGDAHGPSNHSSGNDQHGRDDAHGRGPSGHDHATSTPSPTPTPSPSRTHRSDHDRGSD